MPIKTIFNLVVANLFCLLASSHALACDSNPETQRPVQKIAVQTNHMLLNRDFAGLNKMVLEYRNKNALTSDGQPKLMGFYMGIMYSMSDCRKKQPDAEWKKFHRLLQDWRSASSDKSAANLSLAMYELEYGWYARGGGYAHEVSEEGWRLLKERTNNAKILLDKMGKKERSDPQWYQSRIEVASRETHRGNEYESLYREAIKKFPNYYEFYFSYASYLTPQWGGSIYAFHKFVDQTVKGSNEKMGRVMYTRLHWSHADERIFIDGQTDWKRMKSGFEAILEDFPDLWNRNNFANFACLAKDKKTFVEQINIIKEDILSEAWNGPTAPLRCQYEFGLIKGAISK
jgi:hypothetical protein